MFQLFYLEIFFFYLLKRIFFPLNVWDQENKALAEIKNLFERMENRSTKNNHWLQYFFSCKTCFYSVWTVRKKNTFFCCIINIFYLFFGLKEFFPKMCEAELKVLSGEKKLRGKNHFLTFMHEKQNKIFVSCMKNYFSPGKKKSTTNIFHTDFFDELFLPTLTLFLTHENKIKCKKFHKTNLNEYAKLFLTTSRVINTGRKTV